ncbi:uncharacterized protein LOC103524116 [Trichonephila clavipes]|nr:uncharacterized protein LOC103524116 [Trichonephila clavipes]
MITGGVKTTPVLAMQLLCDLQPFTNIIEKNAAILFNRLIRLPNNSFWRDYDSDGGRNLKTQKGFIQCVPLETINTHFPPEEWLHIYTDGSLLDIAQGAGIGVFSHLFSFYLHAGPLTTHFDTFRVARDKPWSTLCKKPHGIPSSPRAAAVAKFRLLTGHDCLCAQLFRFILVTSPICVLCDTGKDMTAAHLDECSALNDLNCIAKRTETDSSSEHSGVAFNGLSGAVHQGHRTLTTKQVELAIISPTFNIFLTGKVFYRLPNEKPAKYEIQQLTESLEEQSNPAGAVDQGSIGFELLMGKPCTGESTGGSQCHCLSPPHAYTMGVEYMTGWVSTSGRVGSNLKPETRTGAKIL